MKSPFTFKATPIEDVVGSKLAPIMKNDTTPWYKKHHLIMLNLLLLIPIMSSGTNGYDGSLMNGLQSLETWRHQFGHPQGTMLGFVNAAQCFGALMGSLMASWFADHLGRKKSLVFGLFGIVIATIIQSTSKGLGQLIASRWILGSFGQVAMQASPMLIAELAYPSHRGKLTAVFNTFFYAGAILASWTCYGVSKKTSSWGWRIPTLLQMGYPLLQICFLYFLPESPRWLIAHDRHNEAIQILVKYHGGGNEDSELVKAEIGEITEAIEMDKQSKSTSWLQLVKTPGNRKRTYIAITIAIASQWAGNAVISYYFTLVLDTIGYTGPTTQTLINGLLQIFNFIVAVGASLMVDRVGRRGLLLTSSIGMLVSYIIWTVLSQRFESTHTKGYGQGVLAFIFIYFFCYDIGYTPLVVAYPSEIFPFYLRAKGLTVSNASVQMSLIVGGFCNSIAMTNLGWKYYIVFCVLDFLIVLNVYFFYPETKGYSLEEIVQIFDGDDTDSVDVEIAGGLNSGSFEKHDSSSNSEFASF
ncbi:unnamed protein product [Ambrosiozyma monospora]|uniref:Unnamed protein product n=1 Tax=Ambrosiozyma monospora TaxID=43982 RepID=A0A9W6YRF8_AMBMO|nr:unnamed protein product [Ambrosiozyma monospora]